MANRSTLRALGSKASLALAALLATVVPVQADLKAHPKKVGAAIDVGQIGNGKLKGFDAEKQAITRTGVYLTSGGVYDDKLEVLLTVGGLFWFPLPEQNTAGTRLVRFGPGVGQAQGIFTFGGGGEHAARLHFGLFPHKYNRDAANLGEYLYRSGTYPGYLTTGGWSYLNSAAYMAQGLRFNLPTFGGKVVHDFTLFMERDIEPTNDISPGYTLAFKPAAFLEFGAGAVWAHGLRLKKASVITPEKRINAYDKTTGLPLQIQDRDKPGYAWYGSGHPGNDTMVVPDGDPRIGGFGERGRTYVDTAGNGTPRNRLGYYTYRGFKAMVRASADFGALIGSDRLKPGDLRLYGEAALLGIQDQPFYYEKKDERMPIMAGLNVPTFGLFDNLALEVEYHKSRFLNTVGLSYDRQLPLPLASQTDNPYAYSDSAVAADPGRFKKDDWRWSVYARRNLMEGMTLFAQVASDHLRHIDDEVKTHDTPATLKPSEWYYVIRLDIGLF